MADNNFRSYSNRDSRARAEPLRDSASDPLAELARLIGQGDPYAERNSGRSADDAATPGFDWAANEDYAEPQGHAEEHYAPPPLPPASYPAYAHGEQDHGEQDYEPEPPVAEQYFSGSAAKFNGFGGDAELEQLGPVLPPRQLPAFMSPARPERYDAEASGLAQEAGEDYGDYYDEPPRPRQRGGLVVIMAVLGLVVVGTAGAFAYRAMFGSAAFPSLPPIIKASLGPNKIVPNNSAAQADNAAQSSAATPATPDKLVSREEQPVNMEPPKLGSRVVATIPIGAAPMPPSSTAAAPAPAAPSFGTASASALDTASAAPAPMPTAAALPPASAEAQAPPPSEPKKVHTVLIHADQSGAVGAEPAAPAPRGARTAASSTKASASATASRGAANAPLSIMPGAEGEAVASAPSRSRAAAAAPVAVASAEPAETVAASAPSGGRYAVQVTSQHSEADAKASFKELRAKFPNQLSGREPIIRRADLGAKGVYYRAMVGPYASMAEAAGVCSSIKAAGGNCLVQRN